MGYVKEQRFQPPTSARAAHTFPTWHTGGDFRFAFWWSAAGCSRLYVKTRAHVKECVAPARDATRAGVMNEVANAARGHLQECAA
jgi:hypothetical protein